MSQKVERPTLQGQRFRTRKRDEKEKFNPTGFRDTILSSFDALNGGLCLKQQQTATSSSSDIQQQQQVNNNSDNSTIGNNNEDQQQQQQATQLNPATIATNNQDSATQENNHVVGNGDGDQVGVVDGLASGNNTTTNNNNSNVNDNNSQQQQQQQAPIKRQLDIDAVIKCLFDSKIDYRVYGEQLFDIIIAGGILAPGGSILTESSDTTKSYKTDICLFSAVEADDLNTIKNFANIFVRLIQRFGYLEKTLEEEFKKIIVFLKGFEPADRLKLAKLAAILMSLGVLAPHVLLAAIQDHLVKEGHALDFLVEVLKTWLNEKDPNTVWNSLRKSAVDNKLLEFLPANKRSSDTIIQTFESNGLNALVPYQKTKESEAKKIELQKKIAAHIKNKASSKEVVELVKVSNQKNNLEESEVICLIWKTLMTIPEWNKKEELVAEQAIRHLKNYAPLLEAFTKTAKAQLALIIRIQEYCYENMNFLKAFSKIIVILYRADVLTEDIIIDWYKRSHSSKGKSVFLEQTKPFIEWLTSAEEESEGE